MKIEINMNERVKVRLTERGEKELEKQHAELKKTIPTLPDYKPYPKDENGYSSFQLWSLMMHFGCFCHCGSDLMFENTILFETSI